MNKKLTTKGSKFYFVEFKKNLKSIKIIPMTQNLTTYIATFDLEKEKV